MTGAFSPYRRYPRRRTLFSLLSDGYSISLRMGACMMVAPIHGPSYAPASGEAAAAEALGAGTMGAATLAELGGCAAVEEVARVSLHAQRASGVVAAKAIARRRDMGCCRVSTNAVGGCRTTSLTMGNARHDKGNSNGGNTWASPAVSL